MKNKQRLSRRNALTAGTVAATAFAFPAIIRARNLNSKLRIAVVGMGGRANSHTSSLAELEKDTSLNIELGGVCDCDQQKTANAIRACQEKTGHEVTGYDDLRRLLDDKSIDAVTYATPNHWHALGVIWGCQAGKDVYVEKPGSHNIFEGRKMVEAARKYDRIVQRYGAIMEKMRLGLRLTIYSGMLFVAPLLCVLTVSFTKQSGIGFGILATAKLVIKESIKWICCVGG